jgi:hypothetical protein
MFFHKSIGASGHTQNSGKFPLLKIISLDQLCLFMPYYVFIGYHDASEFENMLMYFLFMVNYVHYYYFIFVSTCENNSILFVFNYRTIFL